MSKFNWCMRACGIFLLWATGAVALPAQTFTTLHSFNGTDGAYSNGLVQTTNGNFYGTTFNGGANGGCLGGACGTVFKITPDGTLTTLYNFCSQSGCTDGGNPSGVIQATNGNFYGTTYVGGANGGGTVFKITPGGALTTLYNFCSQANCADGVDSSAGLVQATDGNLYGTTMQGGANNLGTVFKITTSGTLTTLYIFCQGGGHCTDGAQPDGGLVQGTDGNFYGTTSFGGANTDCGGSGCGTVFKITPSGVLTTLHSFDGTDGSNHSNFSVALVQATDGNFYGAEPNGGANGGCLGGACGTVFKITPSGAFMTLHSFDGTDGAIPAPETGLVQATNGDFYGTTSGGGANGDGTVFKITPNGTLTTLHSFDGTDGATSYAGLVQATCGKLYGTTGAGGANGDGTVFSLSVGLGPFVATNPTSGEVGKAVKILGTNLTGATSVTFNGTAATFTVKSKSEITTTVPTGATTGTVQVVTPRRTLSSNVPFRVKP